MANNTYYAFVSNESGASLNAGSSANLGALKRQIRREYGKGWTVVIEKVRYDKIDGWFPPKEVARFTLRK